MPPEPKITGRAVSEIPEHLQDLPTDPNDPFIDQATGLLGQGEIQTAAEEPAADATVDSAIATELPETLADDDQAEIAGGETDDPFADDGSLFGDADAGQPSVPPTDASRPKRGPLGAVFRALTRGAGSNPALKQGQELLETREVLCRAAPRTPCLRLTRRPVYRLRRIHFSIATRPNPFLGPTTRPIPG